MTGPDSFCSDPITNKITLFAISIYSFLVLR